MSGKKKEEDYGTVPVVTSVTPELPPDVYKVTPCNHVNKQHYNTDARLEDLACTLPKGHTGDHFAPYLRNVPDPITDLKGGVIQARYRQEEAEAWWSDAAGTPARDVKEGKIIQLSQFQKDIVAEILRKNPDMTAEAAIEQAKASPIWLAGNV
jgi:hypothetical protein